MDLYTLLKFSLGFCGLLGITIWYITRTITKKGNVFSFTELGTEKEKAWFRAHDKHFNIFCHVIIASFLAGAWIMIGIPFMKDIPIILSGEYCQVQGTVIKGDTSEYDKFEKSRYLIIKEEATGEEVRLGFYTYGVPEGTYVYVRYLPNLRKGSIIYRDPPYERKK